MIRVVRNREWVFFQANLDLNWFIPSPPPPPTASVALGMNGFVENWGVVNLPANRRAHQGWIIRQNVKLVKKKEKSG